MKKGREKRNKKEKEKEKKYGPRDSCGGEGRFKSG